jgi:hypothetical protein
MSYAKNLDNAIPNLEPLDRKILGLVAAFAITVLEAANAATQKFVYPRTML